MSLKNMPHEKLPFRAAYPVYMKEKLIFFHDHHAPWFQRKRFLFHYFSAGQQFRAGKSFADGGLFFTGIIEVKSYPFSKIIDAFPDDQWEVAFRMC